MNIQSWFTLPQVVMNLLDLEHKEMFDGMITLLFSTQ